MRQIPGHPINEQWYRPYTYNDDNGDGILQVSEVHVDSGFKSASATVRRATSSRCRTASISSSTALRIQAMFDYKGGASILDGANNFQCNTGPFACRDTQDPTAPLDRQAAAIAKTYGTSRGTNYKIVGWLLREQSVLEVPRVRRDPAAAGDGHVAVARAARLDPRVRRAQPPHVELVDRASIQKPTTVSTQSEAQNEFQTTGLPTYFTLRLNLKY